MECDWSLVAAFGDFARIVISTMPINAPARVDPESGRQNVSAYGLGTMGYTTLNIDRTGIEGMRFTDHYAQLLHRGTRGIHHWAVPHPLRHDHGRSARRQTRLAVRIGQEPALRHTMLVF
jgi:hypothetical protein